MEFVVVTLAEDWIIERDEPWLDDRRLAMMAPVCEFLVQSAQEGDRRVSVKTTHIMVVEVTVGLALIFVATDMLQQVPTLATSEALWVPSLIHSAHYSPDDSVGAASANDGRSRVKANRTGRSLVSEI